QLNSSGSGYSSRFYAAYDSGDPNTDLLTTFIQDNGDGTSTISVFLSDLNQITGPPSSPPNVTQTYWVGPPDTVTDPSIAEWWKPENRHPSSSIFIYYQMKIIDTVINQEVQGSVINSASMFGFTSGTTTLYDRFAVDKNMAREDENKVHIEIGINPLGVALANGPPNKDENGLISMIDQMSTSLAPYRSSIQFYAKMNGSNYYTPVVADLEVSDAWTYVFDDVNNIITFKIPDETPIILTYNALVKGEAGAPIPIVNTVNLFGEYTSEVEDIFTVTRAKGEAQGQRTVLTVFKVDGHNHLPLEGVVFALYVNAYEHDVHRPSSGSLLDEITIDVGGVPTKFWYIAGGVESTSEHGVIMFDSMYLVPEPEEDQIYLLVEVAAPQYYTDQVGAQTLFSFIDLTSIDGSINQISDNITIENNLNEYISCEVYKDTIKLTSAAYRSLPNQEGFYNVGLEDERYRYDVAFRSTSNIPADEFVLDDPLENIGKLNQVYLEELWTPIVFGDEDGLFNVWFKTNTTSSTYQHPSLNNTNGAFPNTGYRLWKENLSTEVRNHLKVSDLGLAKGEYITALRFEYGAIEVGFTCMNYERTSQNDEHRTASKESVNLDSYNNGELVRMSQSFVDSYMSNGVCNLISISASENRNLYNDRQTFDGIIMLATEPASVQNSINGNNVDWTPDPSRTDYSPGAATADNLKPASYLVSASGVMVGNQEIVSSAIARIATVNPNSTSASDRYFYDYDHDAVLTKVIPTFTGEITELDPYDFFIEDSFVDNAARMGIDLRSSGGRERLRNFLRYGRSYTGDDTNITIWIVGLVASGTIILVLVGIVLFRKRKRHDKKGVVKAISLLVTLMLIALPLGSVQAAPEDELTDNITMEFRYTAGNEADLDIPSTLNQFGREYVLVSLSTPVLEGLLPITRNYSFRIGGALSPADLALVEDMGIDLTPVEAGFERNVDREVVIDKLRTNDVSDLPENMEFDVSSATSASGTQKATLERAGVSFEIKRWEDNDPSSLPEEYAATLIFRGVESYLAVIYYIADVTFSSAEIIDEVESYIVTAIYAPLDGGDIDEFYEEIDDGLQFISPNQNSSTTPPTDSEGDNNPTANIPDSNIPTINIGNTEIPLWGTSVDYVWSLMNLILAIAGTLQIIITVIRTIAARSNAYGIDLLAPEAKEKSRRKRLIWVPIAIVSSVVGILLFVLNEDMSKQIMVLFDSWSIVCGVLFILGIVAASLAFKQNKNTGNDDTSDVRGSNILYN
ncbi:MAG: hypothetical protein FWG21_04935, partial [Oscillospiraceae bacterium]|nr:hypothetical protein [Oscillospiraceae bacterium]